MNKNFLTPANRALIGLMALLCTPMAFAVEITAVDLSNRVITCNSPFLKDAPAGSCLAVPDNTLYITASLDEGEDENVLNEMEVVFEYAGNLYHYNSSGALDASGPMGRWKILQGAGDGTAASFQRMSLEKKSVTRQVNFAPFARQREASLYVGVRSSKSAVFTDKSLKKVFTVK